MSRASSYVMVAGLDFGTDGSAIAYGSPQNKDQILTANGKGKELTAVLLDNDKRFVAYGEKARQVYTNLDPILQERYYFFTNIKMRLYVTDEKEGKAPLMLSDVGGRTLPALDVIVPILNHLATVALQRMNEGAMNAKLTFANVKWVVTVPAIWSEGAKELMAKAAVQAGLCDDKRSNLELALESEAASLACFAQAAKEVGFTWEPGTKFLVMDMGAGTADMTALKVTDKLGLGEIMQRRGGGPWGSSFIEMEFINFLATIIGHSGFIAAYKRKFPLDYQQLIAEFVKIKCSLSAKEDPLTNYHRLPLPSSGSFADFVQSETKSSLQDHINRFFETPTGKAFLPTPAEERVPKPVNVGLPGAQALVPSGVAAAPESGTDKKLREADLKQQLQQAQTLMFLKDRNRLLMCKKIVLSFFGAVIKPAIESAREILRDEMTSSASAAGTTSTTGAASATGAGVGPAASSGVDAKEAAKDAAKETAKGIDYIFLVGGFASSDVLQAEVHKLALEMNVKKVIVPPHAELSVLNGAVTFGIDPTIITSRIARYTYGYTTLRPVDNFGWLHPNATFEYFGAGEFVRIFLPLCLRGDSLAVGREDRRTVFPMYYYQTSVPIQLYRTESVIMYTGGYLLAKDPSLVKLAEIDVPCPMARDESESRPIRVNFNFAHSNIRMTGTDERSGRTDRATAEYVTLA